MANFLFDASGLDAPYLDSFDATCKALKDKFKVEVPGHINFQLQQFEVLKHYNEVATRDAFVIKNGGLDSYMLFLEMSGLPAKKREFIDHSPYQPWALTYLKKDFGRVIIRTETLYDKVKELLLPIELDFKEDKPFSDRFYVLTDDRAKAEEAMNQAFRHTVMSIEEKDFVIEIYEHTLIIGNRKPIAPEHACYLADFVAKVAMIS